MKKWDVIEATFTPRRTDDLQYGGQRFIGVRRLWLVGPRIEEGEPYAGEYQCDPHRDVPVDEWFGWVPSGDLSDVVVVED